jgi:3-oxoacyl-[acyl-carrier protein] reductase
VIVAGTATTSEGAEAITQRLKEEGFAGHGFVLDVTDQASIDAMLTELQLAYSAPTILINNAGITQDNLLLRMTEEDWLRVIDTNLNSMYRLTKVCLRDMIKAKWGRIVNISSVSGIAGSAGQVNYAAAKAGIIGFSKSLAQEIASRNITVNVVAPGLIETDMSSALSEEQRAQILQKVPLNRLGQPEDIAAAVAFLCSAEASYITGVTLHVNGGMYMA